MFHKVVPVNSQTHANKRVKQIASFAFAAKTHIAYLTLQEFGRASSIFPIVFLEDKVADGFRPVALMGRPTRTYLLMRLENGRRRTSPPSSGGTRSLLQPVITMDSSWCVSTKEAIW